MNLRLVLWKLFLLFSLLLLAGGLYFFQIINADAYVRLAANNRLRFIRFAPIRGEIFDRNGVPLAANVTTFDIMGYPLDIEKNNMVENLALLLSATVFRYRRRTFAGMSSGSSGRPTGWCAWSPT